MAGLPNQTATHDYSWWPCLADVLRPFLVMRSELMKTIQFLKSHVGYFILSSYSDTNIIRQFEDIYNIITEHINKCYISVQEILLVVESSKYQKNRHCLVDIDTGLKPKGFHIQNWERLVLSLGLEIEQPDCSMDMDNVSVSTTPNVRRQSLQHVLLVLQAMSDLDPSVASRLLNMEIIDLRALGKFLMDLSYLSERRVPIFITEETQNLWERNQDILETVGFRRISNRHQPRTIEFKNTDNYTRGCRTLRQFFQGLFEDPVYDTLV